MPEQKKLGFIFDLEGVLIDHTARQCEVATKALGSVGIKARITPQMYQLRSEREFHITRDFLSGLYIMQKEGISFEQAKTNPEIVDEKRGALSAKEGELIEEAVKRFDHLRTHGKLELPGKKPIAIHSKEPRLQKIRQMLHWCNKKGFPVAMVTAGKKVDADAFMHEAGIIKYFRKNHLFYGEDKVTKGGLFAEATGMIAGKYHIRPGRQWVIEDSLSGIKDAKANSLRSAMVLTGNTSIERIKKLPVGERPTLVLQHAKDILGTLVHTIAGERARRQRRQVAKIKQKSGRIRRR
ncbi:MAG: HAD family phosphatase [Candidatus Diapherotrites archaeon]|uniref:HAD family phosphatase n=1 Tax=Candidatus Iainarchaeum sp. TaxID=3101447 RepID=A0A938YMC5_9ARCH|nr:HAD family phosphatase [Candidatus Diapherotrites archaeon]